MPQEYSQYGPSVTSGAKTVVFPFPSTDQSDWVVTVEFDLWFFFVAAVSFPFNPNNDARRSRASLSPGFGGPNNEDIPLNARVSPDGSWRFTFR